MNSSSSKQQQPQPGCPDRGTHPPVNHHDATRCGDQHNQNQSGVHRAGAKDADRVSGNPFPTTSSKTTGHTTGDTWFNMAQKIAAGNDPRVSKRWRAPGESKYRRRRDRQPQELPINQKWHRSAFDHRAAAGSRHNSQDSVRGTSS